MRARIAILAGLTAVVLSVGSTPPAAQQVDTSSGNYWIMFCASDTDLCVGYMNAIFGIHMHTEMPRIACLPIGVNVSQARAVVQKYLNDNPGKLHQPFIRLVFQALQKEFPC